MKCISEETVEKTWQTIAEMEPEDAGEAMFEFSEAQPNLLGFVMAFTEDLNDDASELCTYMLYVVYQMFVNSSNSKIPMVSEEQMESQYNATCELLDKIQDANGDPEAAGVQKNLENQPHVYKYVSETLREDSDDPDEQMDISEDDSGEIFMLMKCVIDVVDSVTNG